MKQEERQKCMDCKIPEMPELAFEEKTHTYKLNGVVIPSVSSIMEPINAVKYDRVDSYTLDKAAQKGSAVHDAIENYIKFGIDDIPTEHRGYFDAFIDWWNEYKPVVVGSEIRIYHKLMRYGGTVDLLCYINGELTLVDYKSTYVLSDMTCGVQLEGYAQAFASHGIRVQKKKILHLKKDGSFNVREYPAADAERCKVFGSLKCIYDYIQSNK